MTLVTSRLRNDLSSSAAEKIGIGKKKTAPVKPQVDGEAPAKTKKATRQTS